MELTKRQLEVIAAVFGEQSNVSLPVAVVDDVLEIRKWVKSELEKNVVKTGENPA